MMFLRHNIDEVWNRMNCNFFKRLEVERVVMITIRYHSINS